MTPIQQLMLGAGGPAKKTYLEDLFSTYLYTGTSSARSITTGVDMTKGGMTWIKCRNVDSNEHALFDTERGVTKYLKGNTSNHITDTSSLTAFNNNGFSLGNDASTGFFNSTNSSRTYSSWSFRKSKGWFDVVTWTGNGTSGRQIAHELGSVPGSIWVKRTNGDEDWICYHKSTGKNKEMRLNANHAEASNARFNNAIPTSTYFEIDNHAGNNNNGDEYVAYIFGGGESTAATARSIELTGADDQQYLAAPSALVPSGTDSNKFCVEAWVNIDQANQNGSNVIYSQYASPPEGGRMMFYVSGKKVIVFVGGNDELSGHLGGSSDNICHGGWHHVAWSYDGTTHRIFLDGTLMDSKAGSSLSNAITGNNPRIGGILSGGYNLNGKISNFRVVHGQAVYTSSFKPSTVPLTTTSQGVSGTNCKALCFNQSNELANDGALGNLTNPGSATVTHHTTNSPFDDPAGFKFGENEDQNIIKCGSYHGDSSTHINVNVGFEPQWVLIKKSSDTSNWFLADTMSGIVTNANDPRFWVDTNGSQATNEDHIDLTATGFIAKNNDDATNDDGTHIYIAIRRSDPLVQKPQLATDVFAMDTGAGNSTIPNFDSGFPVDMSLYREFAGAADLMLGTRQKGTKALTVNEDSAESTLSNHTWDSNTGYEKGPSGSGYQSWMWKRHAGFDVVHYTGGGVVKSIRHNLGQIPEMIWVKCTSNAHSGSVYHFGLDGGTNPEQKYLTLNTTASEADNVNRWNDTAPTAYDFTVGASNAVGDSNLKYQALLFSSVAGISKCGYYDGNDSARTITTGFQPRFVIIKRSISSAGADSWFVLDTLRGWGSGNDNYLKLNTSAAQVGYDFGAPVSTGFTLPDDNGSYNRSGDKYIYYAHA